MYAFSRYNTIFFLTRTNIQIYMLNAFILKKVQNKIVDIYLHYFLFTFVRIYVSVSPAALAKIIVLLIM